MTVRHGNDVFAQALVCVQNLYVISQSHLMIKIISTTAIQELDFVYHTLKCLICWNSWAEVKFEILSTPMFCPVHHIRAGKVEIYLVVEHYSFIQEWHWRKSETMQFWLENIQKYKKYGICEYPFHREDSDGVCDCTSMFLINNGLKTCTVFIFVSKNELSNFGMYVLWFCC